MTQTSNTLPESESHCVIQIIIQSWEMGKPNATPSTTTQVQHNKQANMSSNQHYNYIGGRVSRDIKEELETVSIHGEVTAIEEKAFESCVNLTTVTIPDATSLTTIGYGAFYWCNSLQSINIPSSVTTIGEFTFGECESLESITLPSSISIIPRDAFSWCIKLKTIILPNSIKTIEERAFDSCESLESISIPSSVKTIKEYAFHNCSNLQNVEIPSTTTIRKEAFARCTRLSNKSLQQIPYCFTSLTLSSSFKEGPGPKRNFKGETQKGWGPERCGITLQQIKT